MSEKMKGKRPKPKGKPPKPTAAPPKSKEVRGYRGSVILEKGGEIQKRIMMGVPMTGTVRGEWMMAKYGQVIPCNWSKMDLVQWLDQYSPLRFQVADARNCIATACVQEGYEWLVFVDHDVILPPVFLVAVNERIIHENVPMWSGLYFSKSVPAEPLVYRGRGNGYYAKWKMGDKVWVDGIPMGCTVIHRSILQALYDESEEYVCFDKRVRRIFETPTRVFIDPETGTFNTAVGTEDLELCTRIMNNDIFKKAGWPEYGRKKYPFLIDTRLFCWHIDTDGTRFPARGELERYRRPGQRTFKDAWLA